MTSFKRLPDILRGKADIRSDVDAEIAAHLDERIRALMATGLSREAATEEARRRFGDVGQTRREMTSSAIRQHNRGRFDAFAFDVR